MQRYPSSYDHTASSDPSTGASRMRSRDARRRSKHRLSHYMESLEGRLLLATAAWDGGGDGVHWTDPLNWAADSLPAANDDVVIDVATSPTVVLNAGAAVRSVRIEEAFTITGGSLTIAAPSSVNGAFSVVAASGLAVSGAGASFVATAATTVDDANLAAINGGLLQLPNLSGYQTGINHHSFVADGPGSRIELAGLAAAAGSTYPWNRLDIVATNGGFIDLQNTPSLGAHNTNTQVRVEGPGSGINISSLAQMYSTDLIATSGGVITAPALTHYEAGGLFQRYFIADGTGSRLELPALSFLAGNTYPWNQLEINARNGGAIDLHNTDTLGAYNTNTLLSVDSPLSQIDLAGVTQMLTTDLRVTGGGKLAFPLLTSYQAGGIFHRSFIADGPGSTIEMPALLSIAGHTHYTDVLEMVAVNAGLIDLHNLQTLGVLETHISLRPIGPDSHIDLSSVTAAYSVNMLPELGATLALPALETYATGQDLHFLRAAGAGTTLELPALSSVYGSTYGPYNRLFLQALDSGMLNFGTSATVPTEMMGLTMLDGSTGTFNVGTMRVQPVGYNGGGLFAVGTVHGDLINSGRTFFEGFPGTFTIDGDFTQTGSGALYVQIGGTTPGTQVEELHITGSADLCGTLAPELVLGFVPSEGDTFRLLTAGGGRAGEFASVAAPGFGAGLTFADEYGATDASVRAVANVPPSLGSLSISPSPINQGLPLVLTANGASDPNGTISLVRFYFDSNSNGQFEPCLDQLLATDSDGSDGWGVTIQSSSVPLGAQTFFAQARDDDALRSNVVGATVTVEPSTNTAPIARDDSLQIEEDHVLTGSLLDNDQDAEGDPLTATLVDAPLHGQIALNTDGSFTYTPEADFAGADSFTYRASDGQLESNLAAVSIVVQNLPDISGIVFQDVDNDGMFDLEDSALLAIAVHLVGSDDLGTVDRVALTDALGGFVFDDLRSGVYRLEAQTPASLLDGNETAGSLGGTVDNAHDSEAIDQIVVPAGADDANGYLFAKIAPSLVTGLVWEDFNNDGQINFGEKAIADASVELSGTDDRGNSVSRAALTDADGIYGFALLRPGAYSLHEIQPAGYTDGMDVLGLVDGISGGTVSNDLFSNIPLSAPGSIAENYNFGERPADGGAITSGYTATIGFWQNRNGQELLLALNGGPNATQLGNWLAATFPNVYGSTAGAANLADRTNCEVAEFYRSLFRRTARSATALGLSGPPKLDAQFMAVALATYVTNSQLAGEVAAAYGFVVSSGGAGTLTIDVQSDGAAFGYSDYSIVSVMDLLLATNQQTTAGVLYDLDGDGNASSDVEAVLRTLANDIFSRINSEGGI